MQVNLVNILKALVGHGCLIFIKNKPSCTVLMEIIISLVYIRTRHNIVICHKMVGFIVIASLLYLQL